MLKLLVIHNCRADSLSALLFEKKYFYRSDIKAQLFKKVGLLTTWAFHNNLLIPQN